MALTVTVSTTQEIKLAPAIRRKLLTEFRAYAAVKAQMATLQHALDKHKGVIAGLRDETGEQSLEIDGFRTTLVAPIRKKFSPKRFVANGGDLAIYNASIDEVPSRPYEKVSLPGAKDEGDE